MIIRPIVCRTFIGRSDELAYLHERRRAAGASHGGLVLVRGDAGIGKSRLLAEFAAPLSKSRWRVGVGRCSEFAQRPYGPILDVLARFGADAATMGPAASKREQFDAVARAFETAAKRSAIVAIVEDLHWADAATVELLTFLSTRVGGQRILLVISFRPEEFYTEHPSYAHVAKLERAPGAGRIDLEPLEGDELGRFIDDALDEIALPADVRRAVASAGEGNPFFVEELLKSAVERSADGRGGVRELPGSVRVTLLERLRPLTEDERRVLAQAAIIGRTFDLSTLAATLEESPESLLPALQRARRHQLIVESAPSEFRFRHALTREAMYADFLSVQLQSMHRKIALHLENTAAGNPAVERLAYHWWAAADAERAARYNELAGDAAVRVHAHEDALSFYERAAQATASHSIERARLTEKIAERHFALAAHAAAFSAFEAAADVYRNANDLAREATCRVRAAQHAYSLDFSDRTGKLESMLDRIDADDYVARSRVHLGIAWLTATFYRPAESMRHLEQVDERAIEAEPDIRVRFHNIRAWVYMTVGDAPAFGAEHAAWVDAAIAVGSGFHAQAHINGAFCYSLFGFHDDAIRNVQEGIRIARAQRDRHGEASAHAMSAFCYLCAGDLNAVRTAVAAARALPSDSQVIAAHLAAWGTVAAAHLDDEDLTAYCFDELRAALPPFTVTMWAAGYAEILARRGRPAEAHAMLARAIDIGERPRGNMLSLLAVARHGANDDIARARAVLLAVSDAPGEPVERYALELFDAIIAHRNGRHEQAASNARAAADGFERVGFPLLRAEALEIAGRRDAALALYRRCGALHDVRRLDPQPAAPLETNGVDAHPAVLSSREGEIALLVAQGKSNLEIARSLAISHKTVEKHLGSAFQKLGFSSRAQLGAHVSRANAVSR